MNTMNLNQIIPTPLVHPGEILQDELESYGISQAELARAIDVSTRRISEICRGQRGITSDTALRLSLFFNSGNSGAEFWMNLQRNYEAKVEQIDWNERKFELEKIIRSIYDLKPEYLEKPEQNQLISEVN